ncbi:MATH domain and coiled-coil domain-containing protein [Cardamine amara subsp. amara]|uniref:MATH domain and coiled-coil domain-containing protein n=1 Tax=Cardamine amara subsp. amara TaxID=228776 RepID=A0ABD1C8H4_CARAN
MSKQKEKRFSWVLKRFSFLQEDKCYSPTFVVAGCNWRILTCHKGDKNGYLSLYLELVHPESLSSGWRREVKFRLTLVNKIQKQSTKVLEGQRWFDANDYVWGFKEFLPLYKLQARGNGFLVRNKLIIVAELHILPVIGVRMDTIKITEPLSRKDGNQAADVSGEGSDDDDASEEDMDYDDASSLVSEDGWTKKSPLKEGSLTVRNRGMSCNNVPVSNANKDDSPREDPYDDPDYDASSLHLLKSMVDTSQTVENGATGCNNMASVTETSNNLLKETQPAKETTDVNGFQVFSSQVQSVSHIFKRHPDIALGFRPKNQQIRRAYMDALLRLIETLCQSPEKLSEDDLSNADDTLVDLIDAGLKVDWLKTKLNEVSEKKKTEQGSKARLQTMEEKLQKLKHMFLDLESQLQKEKEQVLAMRAPLSFKDVVY